MLAASRAQQPTLEIAAHIIHDVELDALDGSFEVTLLQGPEPAEGAVVEIRQPTFRLSFSGLGAEGRFDALLVERSADVATGRLLEFALWSSDRL